MNQFATESKSWRLFTQIYVDGLSSVEADRPLQ